MRKIIPLLILIFGAFTSQAKISLPYIQVRNSQNIKPKHDGVHYFIDNDQSLIFEEATAQGVKNAVNAAREAGKVVYDFLSINIQSDLPVVVSKQVGGVEYEILLDKLVFTPQGNTISIAATITMPDGNYYAFGGKSVTFSGKGGIEALSLTLLLDNQPELKTRQLHEGVKVLITGGGFSYDCDGFKSVSVFGKVSFSRDLLLPENGEAKSDFVNPSGMVTAEFKLNDISDFNDMTLSINMPPFQFTKMKGYGFEVSEAIIDLSAKQNAPFFHLPKGYTPDIDGTGWMGVSIKSIQVRFPPQFENRKTKSRVSAEAKGILIDKYGFSGEVLGKNILQLTEGNASGWDISISNFGLIFLKSQITAGKMEGKIRPSVVETEDQALFYSAQIDPIKNYYSFNVEVADSLEFSFLKAANVLLTKNSYIKLSVENQKFHAKANLNGRLDIRAQELKLKSYTFQSLLASTDPPYLFVGYFGKTEKTTDSSGVVINKSDPTDQPGDNFNGFTVTMKEPKILNRDENVAVTFGLMVNLDKMGVSAEGDFIIEGAFENHNERHFWKNKSFSLGKVKVTADLNPVSFMGELEFIKNDPVYGKAFFGRLDANLNFGSKYKLKSAAMFGTKDRNRYWFVDLMFEPSNGGDPIKKGAIKINMLSGFVYRHMKASAGGSGPRTLSGMRYEPAFNVNWGLKAALGFGIGGGASMQAFGGIEIETRADNSIAKLGIMANISMANSKDTSAVVSPEVVKSIFFAMSRSSTVSAPGGITSKLEKKASDPSEKETFKLLGPPPSSGSAGFSATAMIKFDFDQRSFYGELGADVTLTSGVRVAGFGAMLISPEKNFLHLGEPPAGKRILVKMPSLPQFDAYFMIGDLVPELPPPFPNIFDLYPEEGSKRLPNNMQAVAEGKGIAFGAAVEVSNSNSFKVLSWNLGARVGLDMILIKYPNGTYCYGLPGNEVGINNWRAMGQVYMIGWFDFRALGMPVASLGLGAVLKGSAPNPSNAMGQVVVNFKLLFKKFEYKAMFQVGDECQLVTGEEKITQEALIEVASPENGQAISDQNSVWFTASDEFNKNLALPDQKFPTQLRLISYKLYTNQQELSGLYTINGENAFFMPTLPLQNYTEYTYQIKVRVDEMVAGQWKPLLIDGKEIYETKTATFRFEATAEQLGNYLQKQGELAGNNISEIGRANIELLKRYLGDDLQAVKNLSTEAFNALKAMLEACGGDEACVKIALVSNNLLQAATDSTTAKIKTLIEDYTAKIRAVIAQDSALAYQSGYSAQAAILANQSRFNSDFTRFQQNFYTTTQVPACTSYFQYNGIGLSSIISDPNRINALYNAPPECVEKLRELKSHFIAEKNRLETYYGVNNQTIVNNTLIYHANLQSGAAEKARNLVDEATGLSAEEKEKYLSLVKVIVAGAFNQFSSVASFNQTMSTVELDAYIKKFDAIAAGNTQEPFIACKDLSKPSTAPFVIIGDEATTINLSATGCVNGSQYRWQYLNRDNILKIINSNTAVVNDYSLSTTFQVACVSKGCTLGVKDSTQVYIKRIKEDGCKYIEPPKVTTSILTIARGDSILVTATGCSNGFEWSNGITTDATTSQIMLNPTASTTYWVSCLKPTPLPPPSERVAEENKDLGPNPTNDPTAVSRPACEDTFIRNTFTVYVNNGCQTSYPYILARDLALAAGEKIEIQAEGCPAGKLFWTSTDTTNPDDFNGNVLPLVASVPISYRVYCKSNLCTSPFSEKVTITIIGKDKNGICDIQKPQIKASRTVITDIDDPKQNVYLEASGGPAGSTFQWSFTDNLGKPYTGPTLDITTPRVNTSIYVLCKYASCASVASEIVNIVVKDPCIGATYPGLYASQEGNTFTTGTPIKLTATNCPIQNITWSNGQNGVQSIDFIADITQSVRSYTVTCLPAGCSQTKYAKSFSFQVLPCDIAPAIAFDNNNQVLIYDPQTGNTINSVGVSATGCSNAQISWKINGNVVSSAPSIAITKNHFPDLTDGRRVSIELTCSRAYCETKTAGTRAKLSFYDQCNKINEYSISISANKDTHSGEGISLTASGCPHQVTWSDGQQGNNVVTYHHGNVTYTASCAISGCSNSISSNSIQLYFNDPCSAFYNGPGIYAPNDGSQTLQATNCYHENYSWNTGSNSSRIKVWETGNYQVICNDEGCGWYSKDYYWQAPQGPSTTEGSSGDNPDPGKDGSTSSGGGGEPVSPAEPPQPTSPGGVSPSTSGGSSGKTLDKTINPNIE
jgi:hypothetical protein